MISSIKEAPKKSSFLSSLKMIEMRSKKISGSPCLHASKMQRKQKGFERRCGMNLKLRARCTASPMIEGKNTGGRPFKDRVKRSFTIDREAAEYVDSLTEGSRSDFVSSAIITEIARRRTCCMC